MRYVLILLLMPVLLPLVVFVIVTSGLLRLIGSEELATKYLLLLTRIQMALFPPR